MISTSHNALIAIVACVALSSCGSGQTYAPREAEAPPPAQGPQAVFQASQQLYAKQCAVCHGALGRGDGPAAYLLYPKPRNFTLDEYRLISTDDMSATDEDLLQTITRGMPGSSMPSWERLTEPQRRGLVSYVRYLEEVGEELEAGELTQAEVDAGLPWNTIKTLMAKHAAHESMALPDEPVRSSAGLARGREIYVQACAACHGPHGKGDGQQIMVDSEGFPIRPRDLTAGILKGSSSSRDLYYRIMAGLPGSPMPSYAGAYTDEEIWRLVHYVQSLVPEGVEDRMRMRPQIIHASRVSGDLTAEPFAQTWSSVASTYVAVTPLWWRDDRSPGVDVQAMHNGKQLAVRLSWADPRQDQSVAKTELFSDGIAVQLSVQDDPPFFGMGGPDGAVDIWHWKAAWEQDLTARQDVDTVYPDMAVEYYPEQHTPPQPTSAAESAQARGQGTLTSHPAPAQNVQARGVWRDDRWTVVLIGTIPARSPASVAVAVWDGAAGDRDGQKSFSIWHTLTLD